MRIIKFAALQQQKQGVMFNVMLIKFYDVNDETTLCPIWNKAKHIGS